MIILSFLFRFVCLLTPWLLYIIANHLDLSAIRWLSDLIKDKPKITLLTVTHDRFFLEDVCNTVLELDRGSLYSYEGNYATFLEKKADRLAIEDAAIQAAKSKYRVELDWMRRQPQASCSFLPLMCVLHVVIKN